MADIGSSEQISFYNQNLTTTFPNSNFGLYGKQFSVSEISGDILNTNLINTIFQSINNGVNIGEMPITYYLMRWADPDCGSPTYRTWVVEDNPDPTGLEYAGPKCGVTPISGAVVAAKWTE